MITTHTWQNTHSHPYWHCIPHQSHWCDGLGFPGTEGDCCPSAPQGYPFPAKKKPVGAQHGEGGRERRLERKQGNVSLSSWIMMLPVLPSPRDRLPAVHPDVTCRCFPVPPWILLGVYITWIHIGGYPISTWDPIGPLGLHSVQR